MIAHRAYLLDVSRRIPKMRTFTELVDILVRYRYTEFILYSEGVVGGDVLGTPKLSAYCEMQGLKLVQLDRAAWEALFLSGTCVAVSTESRSSLAGRVEEMRERMEKAEEMARARGATSFVVTDFADDCQWQPLAASLPGIIMGGNFASAGAKSAKMDLERELNAVLDAPLGGLLLKLATLYLCGNAKRADASELFNILSNDHGYSRHPNLTQKVLDEVSGVAHATRIAAERWSDRSDWAKEIAYMAQLVDCACHRRDEARLRALRDTHGHIWRLRFEEDGRIESLARLPRF